MAMQQNLVASLSFRFHTDSTQRQKSTHVLHFACEHLKWQLRHIFTYIYIHYTFELNKYNIYAGYAYTQYIYICMFCGLLCERILSGNCNKRMSASASHAPIPTGHRPRCTVVTHYTLPIHTGQTPPQCVP